MEATESTSSSRRQNNATTTASDVPLPSPPTEQLRSSTKEDLKSFLQRHKFDTNFKLTANPASTSKQSPTVAPRLAPNVSITSASRIETCGRTPIDIVSLASPEVSDSIGPSLPLIDEVAEGDQPTSFFAETLLSSSNSADKMSVPGLGGSRWAQMNKEKKPTPDIFAVPSTSGNGFFATPTNTNGFAAQNPSTTNGTNGTTPVSPFSIKSNGISAITAETAFRTPHSNDASQNKENSPSNQKLTGVHSRLAGLRAKIAKRDALASFLYKEDPKQVQPAVDQISEQAEIERIAKENAEAERLVIEKAEAERVAIEKAKAERIAEEKAEVERVAKEKAETERIAKEKAEAERIAKEKAEAERIAKEKAEAERRAKEKAEAERRAKVQAELNAVVAKIEELEKQEQDRASTHSNDVVSAKDELAEAQDFYSTTVDQKKEVEKALKVAADKYEGAKKSLETLKQSSEEIQADLEEAQAIVHDSKKMLASLENDNANAIEMHKKAVAQLVEDKQNLVNSLNSPGMPIKIKQDLDVPQTHDPAVEQAIKSAEVGTSAPAPTSLATALTESKPKATTRTDNLKSPQTFEAWPDKKPRPPSAVRSVRLENIPSTNELMRNVSRLVFHGTLHCFNYEPGNSWAKFTFLKAEDCAKYLEATKNGIPWPEAPTRIIITEPCEPESGGLEVVRVIIEKNLTRCVRIVDIDDEWKPKALFAFAKDGGKRKVDRVVNGHDSKARRICDFQFCSVADAVTFRSQAEKHEDFVKCLISYATDPCTSTAVRKGPI